MSDADGYERVHAVDELFVVELLFLPFICIWPLLSTRYSGAIRLAAGIYALLVLLGVAQTIYRLVW